VTDLENWGVVERWSHPDDGYGDCEDYALLKRRMLIEAGWPREALLLTPRAGRGWRGYSEVPVLKSVSLSVMQGEIFALLGKNGMGKTTLLRTILGFLKLRTGTITFGGVDISDTSPNEMVKAGVAYAPQERPLFHDLSIRDNLRLALRSDAHFDEAAARVFEYVPFLKDRLSQKAGTLSGGEQKMLITVLGHPAEG